MALPLGKLAILIGAGIVGSVLAKEGRLSNGSDFLSGALKIAFRQLKNDGSATTNAKPKDNATLLQQVNILREELQLLASNRPITIVTSTSSGSGKYSIIIVVVVVGYGYVWWKGWKLSDMMFATRSSLSDACSNVSKQLESVYSSISAVKRHLSSILDRVDCKIDESTDEIAATKDQVSKLREKVRTVDIQSIRHNVQHMMSRVSSMEDKEGHTNRYIGKLITLAQSYKSSGTMDQIEGGSSSSSIPALELPQVSPSRAESLPSNLFMEPTSPSTSKEPFRQSKETNSGSGLRERVLEASNGFQALGQSSPRVPTGNHSSDSASSGSSGSGFFDLKSLGKGPMVRRSFSASVSFKV